MLALAHLRHEQQQRWPKEDQSIQRNSNDKYLKSRYASYKEREWPMEKTGGSSENSVDGSETKSLTPLRCGMAATSSVIVD